MSDPTAAPTLYKVLKPNGMTHQAYGDWANHLPTANGDGTWTPGEWWHVVGPIQGCRNGLHGWTADGLVYELGRTITTDYQIFATETAGDIDVYDEHKMASRSMRLLRPLQWSRQIAVLWACDCAERALTHFETRRPDDRRPREAIEMARRWTRGEATVEQVHTARAAAWEARRAADAAYAAYADATYAAAAAYAAYAADAAAAAAYAAAAAAAYAAAYAAARRQAREWQATRLVAYLKGRVGVPT